jgi:NADPH-dependent 2,4-dienoyl-CoA reductase/sulfur reductase-like enzyme
MTCVVIGGGAAGLGAALAARKAWPDKPVVLIDSEEEIGYYRALLPPFMVGMLEEEKLFFWRQGEDPLLTILRGTEVERLDCAARRLHLGKGGTIEYDRLVLCHGGSPDMPGILSEQSCEGIFPVRGLTAARKAKEWLAGYPEVVILGSSLVGVKTAVYLRMAGLKVSMIVRRDHTLLRVLSARAAGFMDAHLQRLGVNLHFNCHLEDLQVKNEAIDAVRTGQQWLPCRTLLVAAGSTPDSRFLEGSGLLEEGELKVSSSLQTRDPRIFAAGDGATIRIEGREDLNPGTWPHAVTQGKLAGENLYASAPRPLGVLTRVNCMNLSGLPLVILGPPVSGAETVSYSNRSGRVYRELFVVDGRIVGGALVGDITGAGPLHALINQGETVGERARDLVCPHGRALHRFAGSGVRDRRAFLLASERVIPG